jgi:hypothetical protein
MTETIARQWKSFEEAVIPQVGYVQRTEMRKAFYAGCQAMFNMMTRVSDTDDEAAALRGISAINFELEHFIAETQQ